MAETGRTNPPTTGGRRRMTFESEAKLMVRPARRQFAKSWAENSNRSRHDWRAVAFDSLINYLLIFDVFLNGNPFVYRRAPSIGDLWEGPLTPRIYVSTIMVRCFHPPLESAAV